METFKALVVTETEGKQFQSELVDRNETDLPEGEVVIRVKYSSLNYKDALSASGNKGVTRQYPHTPGIDAAGEVLSSSSDKFAAGDEVIVTGYDLGMNTAGGFGQLIRVPASWVLACPAGLGARNSMILGTAGLTAALCVDKLLVNGMQTEDGDVLVTGATGGVGIIAVALLAKLGFSVVASTGKSDARDLLLAMGASDVIDRSEFSEANNKPMVRERWAGAVDVVGGETLFNVIKSLNYGASVAACGLVQSPFFQASVFPFILRGVNLLGVDSVELPLSRKQEMWSRLSADWKLDKLDNICTEIGFAELDARLKNLLRGEASGRYLLNLG